MSQAAAVGTAGLERGITRGYAFRRSGRTWEAAVSHPALVNEVLFWLVVLLTLLLVMFLYAVITAHTEDAKPAEAPVPEPPVLTPPTRTPPAPVAPILGIAGVALAVIGGWMFLNVPHADLACSHQAAAICLQGSVLLTGTQLLGGAIALAGIALAVTALLLALRS